MTGKLLRLLKWDFLLLHRNSLVILSLFLAVAYAGIFYLLRPLGNLDVVLLIILFNDPVVTGFMFAGIIMLFEKTQNTLSARRVVPLPIEYYFASKAIALTTLSLLTAVLIVLSIRAPQLSLLHTFSGIAGTTLFFTFCGFFFSFLSKTFQHFLLFSIGFLVLNGIPFLWLAGLGKAAFYLVFPSFAGLVLMKAGIGEVSAELVGYAYFYLVFSTWIAWKVCIRKFNTSA